MNVLKVLVWTGLSIALGIVLATWTVGGRTPLERAQHLWSTQVRPSRFEQLKGGLRDAYDDVKDKVTASSDRRPQERHSAEDRNEVNKLVAKRSGK